jgi:hypothetical protein
MAAVPEATPTPQQIALWVNLVIGMTLPPALFRPLPPEATLAEQVDRADEWLLANEYKDPVFWIVQWPTHFEDGRDASEIFIALTREDEWDPEAPDATVFLGYAADEDENYEQVLVERFDPGPWCTHLRTLALRACAILRERWAADEAEEDDSAAP